MVPAWLWPDVADARMRSAVLQNAVLTAASVAVSYVLDPLWLFATGHALFAAPIDGADVATLAATSAALAALAATVAWSLWRAPSRIAAALLIAITAFEAAEGLAGQPPSCLTAALWTWGWFYALHGYRVVTAAALMPERLRRQG